MLNFVFFNESESGRKGVKVIVTNGSERMRNKKNNSECEASVAVVLCREDLQKGRLQQLEAVAEKVGKTFSIKNLHQRKQS